MLELNAIKKAEGYQNLSGDGIYNNINYSDIFTELIKTAGEVCEHYASDLFYDLKAVDNYIENLTDEENTNTRLIAFRKFGVDGDTFIQARKDGILNAEYIKVYELKIENRMISYCSGEITMELKRIK